MTIVQIPPSLHDLALSGPVARQRCLDEMFDWADTHAPGSEPHPE